MAYQRLFKELVCYITMNKNCPNCSKKLGIFKTGLIYRYDNKRFCSVKCKKEYKNNEINSEVKCICNKCNNVWYVQKEEEKQIKTQAVGNALIGLGMFGSPAGSYFFNKSMESSRKVKNLRKCPKCSSVDIQTEISKISK